MIHGEVALADLSLSAIECLSIALQSEPSRWLALAAGICSLAVMYRAGGNSVEKLAVVCVTQQGPAQQRDRRISVAQKSFVEISE